ncbi:restriction endonuclease subunit S [Lactiplantibacillus plantarum]|uniref:restriction endonuclease subunit S n=1 Tax=Lactiplantibacillus plantarum TaxID=1590 RepID=UPI0021F7C272|nr:restriction endonuclease subunit S [Lactiplantibacillus plantarum]MCW0154632.1 restriction endonuclease subunit S [Lactiplantibacillus plantarum]
MNAKQAKYPQLRFKGFTDPWEQRKFESLLNKNDGIRRGPFGSALKKEFFVPKSEYVVYEQQNAIYDNYKTRYNITKKKFDELSRFELRPNDFIMSGAGTIGRISRVPNDIKKGVFNQALIRFRINTSITDSEYFVQFIRADFMQRKLTNANPGSAITNLVPMSEVKKWIIQFPNLKEQQKIGTFFQQLDHLITLHQRKLAKLKELKQGYLQKMFPQNGSKFPQLRFTGFADAWEERKLGDITTWTKGQGLSKEYLNNERYGSEAVHYADLYKFSPVMQEVIHWTNSDDGRIIPDNSLLFPASDVTPVGLARTSTLKLSGVKAGGDVIIGQLSERINSSFMSYQINANSKKILPLITGTTVKHVQAKSLATMSVTITNMAEQTAIAGLFERIDNTIALHQRKLEKLQELKKGYLQKMFC